MYNIATILSLYEVMTKKIILTIINTACLVISGFKIRNNALLILLHDDTTYMYARTPDVQTNYSAILYIIIIDNNGARKLLMVIAVTTSILLGLKQCFLSN